MNSPKLVDEDEYWVSMEDPDTGETFRWNKYIGKRSGEFVEVC